MLKEKTIGIIGAGSMSEALIRGLCNSGVPSNQVIVTNKANRERLEELSRRFGIRATRDKAELVGAADLLIIAVKPKDIADLLREIGSLVRSGQVIISVAAGVHTSFIEERLTPGVEVIRAMPNIAVLAAQGASALFSGPGVTQDNEAIALKIFGTVGKAILVRDESLLDAVTGLSGSGPAYIFLVLEALSDAGVRMGLTREMATTLAIQTLLGAAHMAQTTAKSFSELKDMVTSPGGTTIEGLKKLEERRVRAAFMEAVEAATIKAKQLSSG